jgi:hypothetical protein
MNPDRTANNLRGICLSEELIILSPELTASRGDNMHVDVFVATTGNDNDRDRNAA